MASPAMLADRAWRHADRPRPICVGCGIVMPGPGTCRDCLAYQGKKALSRPVAGTRHARRRAAGISRSKAGR